MYNIKYVKENLKFLTDTAKLQTHNGYYSLLFEYEFNENVDFQEFINVISNSESKDEYKKVLNKFRRLGKLIETTYYDDKEEYYSERSEKYYEAIEKNNDLIYQLYNLRKDALGIGTNKLKKRLNKLGEKDPIAKALRIAFEIEDKSTQAKDSYGKYRRKIYNQKRLFIESLIELFLEQDNWVFGKQSSDVAITDWIIFFEIPNCEQISFHTDLYNGNVVPKYTKEWDGKINSTFEKLLDCVIKLYPDINK